MIKQLWVNSKPLLDDENNPYQVERIEFGDDEIVGYIGRNEIFALRGLNPENTYEVRDNEGNAIKPDLLKSVHVAALTDVSIVDGSPRGTVVRKYLGENYTVEDCRVSQSAYDNYQAGKIKIYDTNYGINAPENKDSFVVVCFISESPYDNEVEIPVIVDKVIK